MFLKGISRHRASPRQRRQIYVGVDWFSPAAAAAAASRSTMMSEPRRSSAARSDAVEGRQAAPRRLITTDRRCVPSTRLETAEKS